MYSITHTDRTDFLPKVEAGLTAHNNSILGDMPRLPANVILEAQDGTCMGGIKASSVGKHFFVSWLYVDDVLRGQGWGAQLMQAAEEEARKRGCTASFVDTMSFQAPAFYEKLGYIEVSRVNGYYEGHDRIFFRKALA